jgi:hypothetical protein
MLVQWSHDDHPEHIMDGYLLVGDGARKLLWRLLTWEQ